MELPLKKLVLQINQDHSCWESLNGIYTLVGLQVIIWGKLRTKRLCKGQGTAMAPQRRELAALAEDPDFTPKPYRGSLCLQLQLRGF